MQLEEENIKGYEMFKGLQRPLEIFGLQGRYITWAAITVLGSLIGFIVVYIMFGFLYALIVTSAIISVGTGLIIYKRSKGIYSKKEEKGIFIYAKSECL